MIIDRQQAIRMVDRGEARARYVTRPDCPTGAAYVTLDNLVDYRVDHYQLMDNDPCLPCATCGSIQAPMDDGRCPLCHGQLV